MCARGKERADQNGILPYPALTTDSTQFSDLYPCGARCTRRASAGRLDPDYFSMPATDWRGSVGSANLGGTLQDCTKTAHVAGERVIPGQFR